MFVISIAVRESGNAKVMVPTDKCFKIFSLVLIITADKLLQITISNGTHRCAMQDSEALYNKINKVMVAAK